MWQFVLEIITQALATAVWRGVAPSTSVAQSAAAVAAEAAAAEAEAAALELGASRRATTSCGVTTKIFRNRVVGLCVCNDKKKGQCVCVCDV